MALGGWDWYASGRNVDVGGYSIPGTQGLEREILLCIGIASLDESTEPGLYRVEDTRGASLTDSKARS